MFSTLYMLIYPNEFFIKLPRGGSICPATFSNSQNFFSGCRMHLGFFKCQFFSILNTSVQSGLSKSFRIFLKKLVPAPRYAAGQIGGGALGSLRYGNLIFDFFDFLFKSLLECIQLKKMKKFKESSTIINKHFLKIEKY